MNAVSLHIIHGRGAITAVDAIKEMKVVAEDKRRELLRMVLQESSIPRACKDLFWKMAKVLNLFYIKDDGFTSHEMSSTVKAVLEEPVVLDMTMVDAQ